MHGDQLVIEAHHRRAAEAIFELIIEDLRSNESKKVVTIAGESGSGKSETAEALADCLRQNKIDAVVFQQDDYYVHPPRTNDRTRREDIAWVGPNEVRLDLLDQHAEAFRRGDHVISKPLVDYAADSIGGEEMAVGQAQIAIAEGTYTTLLENADWRVFINRTAAETRAHREKRQRHVSELDEFTERVLAIEHEEISGHKKRADIIIESDYSVHRAENNA